MRLGARIDHHVGEMGSRVAVAAGRLPPESEQRGLPDLSPDLVVEAVSPSDQAGEVLEAVVWVGGRGAPRGVVYPDQRLVVVHGAGGSVQQVGAGGELDGADVLPGLRIAVDDLFSRSARIRPRR